MIASLESETPQNAERGIGTGIPFEVIRGLVTGNAPGFANISHGLVVAYRRRPTRDEPALKKLRMRTAVG